MDFVPRLTHTAQSLDLIWLSSHKSLSMLMVLFVRSAVLTVV
jgi:hypothetical protein